MQQLEMFGDCFVDSFAGGGGASTGIEMATGHPVDIAINHNEAAIMMHKMNHPFTEHYREDIWQVEPKTVVRGRHVRLAWFSPDCKHFSRAKGAALVDKKIRGLAWVVLRWAATVKPDVIMLENVPEFTTWGPVRKGKPVKKKAGQTYRKWLLQLKALGYEVETKMICAADLGAPTIRTRFHLIARCDGKPIVFPENTHAPKDDERVKNGELKPWRSASEIIDFSLPCPSIFASKKEIKETYGVNAVRPLKENTLRRIARGLDKFVIKSAKPFIVECNHKGEGHTHCIDKPNGTVTAKYSGGIVAPSITPFHMHNHSNASGTDINRPVNTVTGVGAQMLIEPLVTPYAVCNNSGNAPHSMNEPLSTITTGGRNILVAPSLIQYHTEQTAKECRGQTIDVPLQTVDAANRYGFVSTFLSEWYGNARDGIDLCGPMQTITGKDREALTVAFCSKYFTGVDGADIRQPTPTITAVDHNSMVLSHLAHFKGNDKGQSTYEPLMTVTASDGQFADVHTTIVKWDGKIDLGYWEEVRQMLNLYCGYELAEDEILLLNIGGAWYFISDIGLRMLTPRELYDAMGFPHDYVIDRDVNGKLITREDQVARCGNAVCPAVAEALVRANLPEYCNRKITDMEQLHTVMAS